MSDDNSNAHPNKDEYPPPPTIDELTSITYSDIIAFIKERVKNHACPACRNNTWEVSDVENAMTGLVANPTDGSYSLPPPIIPMVATWCKQCGFVRLHASILIALWKRGRGDKTDA
ncbi:MAG: hypothetical protein AB7E55_31510 [Pigmentiphaga sp.]